MSNNKHITVVPADGLIIIDDDSVITNVALVPGHESLHALQYDFVAGLGTLEFEDDYNQDIDATLFADEVKPYVDQFNKVKAEVEAYNNSFEVVKARKLDELRAAVSALLGEGHVSSSVGFEVNADKNSASNIAGLIAVGVEPVQFMDYNNTTHSVTLDQLKTIYAEVLKFQQSVMAKKWAVRDQINACQTSDQLKSVVWDENLCV